MLTELVLLVLLSSFLLRLLQQVWPVVDERFWTGQLRTNSSMGEVGKGQLRKGRLSSAGISSMFGKCTFSRGRKLVSLGIRKYRGI